MFPRRADVVAMRPVRSRSLMRGPGYSPEPSSMISTCLEASSSHIPAYHELLERVYIALRNFERLADIEYQVLLAVGDRIFGKYQLDDLYDQYEFLLHREGLVYLLHDLHDVRPVVYKLLGISIETA